jgi:tetratricopeptide (TPR) repeat protein
MADIFISYSREDHDRVRPLAEALSARGFVVWWDRALAAGDDYAAIIARELEVAKAVVVVWSASSSTSAWVRDEAARARETARLVPVRIDAVEAPLGFGQVHIEDLSSWRGSPEAPEMDLLAAALHARIAGAPVDANVVVAARKRAATNRRLMTILAAVAALGVIAGSLALILRPLARDVVAEAPAAGAPAPAGDPLTRLLDLVEQGKITGAEAVRLAELLKQQAFADVPASPPLAAPASLDADADSAAQAAAAGFDAAARDAFSEAAVQLLQDPDKRVRAAILEAARPQSRAQALDALWALAGEGPSSAAAIYRACGALMAAVNDPRAREALERARRLNPQDKRVWSLLSVAYARERRPRDAAGAALVGAGLETAALGRRDEAQLRLESALEFLREKPDAKAFVLGQLGDAAAARSDWDTAEKFYREAVRLHTQARDAGALSLEVAKLARAQLAQSRPREACRTLDKARGAGAMVSAQELETACRPEATGGVGPPGPLRITPAPLPPG